LRLKNRMAVSPHGTRLTTDGVPTEDFVAYQIEKIKGGAGLLIISPGSVDPEAAFPPEGQIDTWRREIVPYLSRIVDAGREHDCRVIFQINQASGNGLAPSGFPFTGVNNAQTITMSDQDIRRMHENYGICAELLAEAGFDGIELHGHGDLFTDFLSPTINRRQDKYGGSIENRLRYVFEAIEVIRAHVGDEILVGLRHLAYDGLPDSVDLDEGVRLATLLADRVDYLNVDIMRENQFLSDIVGPMYVPHGHQRYAAAAVKKAVTSIPVFCVGRITTPYLAEEILAAGEADVVTMARALIADPEFPNKVAEGRPEDIRLCLGDNQECWARGGRGAFSCTVNPAAGHEIELGIGTLRPAPRAKSVVVVGGGPAGMEAARTAAQRGHSVTLFERSDRLGGQVLMGRSLPGREEIGNIIDWLPRQMELAGVKVVLGTEATRDRVIQENPDAVVVATGARWLKSGFNGYDYTTVQGWDDGRVFSVPEALDNLSSISGNVVVYDQKGFVEGPGIAELLARPGNTVTILNPLDTLLGSPFLERTLQRDHLQRRLDRAGVSVLPQRRLRSIEGPVISVENTVTKETSEIGDVAAVVIIGGRDPDPAFDDLGDDVDVHLIGDCVRPNSIGSAIADGHRVGRLL